MSPAPDIEHDLSNPLRGSGTAMRPSKGAKPLRRDDDKHIRRRRKPISCKHCRDSKLRCDRQVPCASCKRRNCVDLCLYINDNSSSRNQHNNNDNNHANRTSTTPTAHLLSVPGSNGSSFYNGPASPHSIPTTPAPSADEVVHGLGERTIAAAEQDRQDYTDAHWNSVLQRPIDQVDSQASLNHNNHFPRSGGLHFPFQLGPQLSMADHLINLPPTDCCEYLITQYFTRLSPLFHILHGPTFQRQYNEFVQDPIHVDLSWLALLFTICSVAVHTMEENDAVLADIWSKQPLPHDNATVSYRFRVAAMTCLSQDNFLTRQRLNTLEALLILIYTISHNEGVENSWTLLGMALNIGIALKCNVDSQMTPLNCIEIERRRRCWAGILVLHTNQAISFRDVDMSFLLNTKATMPIDTDDDCVHEGNVVALSKQPTQMSVMKFKIQLCQLSSRICRYLSDQDKLDETTLSLLDAEVAGEQRQWDAVFLPGGSPSILDISSYAHWCILQLYAHQLYLLLHQPFCRTRASNGFRFRMSSRLKCITSGAALLDFHRQFCELPRLRHYRWYVYGMTSSYAVHGAIALASCLLEKSDVSLEISLYRMAFDAAVERLDMLQSRSPICVKACPILRHLQTMLSPEQFQWSSSAGCDFGNTFDDWYDAAQWLNPDSVDWNFWNEIINNDTN